MFKGRLLEVGMDDAVQKPLQYEKLKSLISLETSEQAASCRAQLRTQDAIQTIQVATIDGSVARYWLTIPSHLAELFWTY